MSAGRLTCVVLTPSGPGAIALIRVRGPAAAAALSRTFRPGQPGMPLQLGELRYGSLADGAEVIDEVIVGAAGPETFDICAHGGTRVIERILLALERVGVSVESAEHAWPCENPIECEALALMPAAKTPRALEFLSYQRTHLAQHLRELAAACTSDGPVVGGRLAKLQESFRSSLLLLDGARIVLIGPPNSGKSTLFNQLVGRRAAVVSDRPGTTRDWVSADIELNGFPITLLDTPGHHETPDPLERQAIIASQSLEKVDFALLVLDGSQPLAADARAAVSGCIPFLPVVNKTDRAPAWRVEQLADQGAGPPPVLISALSGAGIDALQRRLLAALGIGPAGRLEPALFSDRQVRITREVLRLLLRSDNSQAAQKICSQLIGRRQDSGLKGSL